MIRFIKEKFKSRNSKRILFPLIILVSIYLLGTIGYMVIEKWSFLEALFMSTITVTTVGYTLVRDLSPQGMLYTIFFIVLSTGTAAYIVINVADLFVQNFLIGDREVKRIKKMIEKLKNHYIICGLGRVGSEIARTLEKGKTSFVVIDKNEESIEECNKNKWICIKGDATRDEILLEAGIERAKGLFAAIGDDSENIYSVLSAKSLNTKIYIVARASAPDAINKLQKAGADRIITPEIIGARRMASLILQPAVSDFFESIFSTDAFELELAVIEVMKGSKIEDIAITEAGSRFKFSALIISIVDVSDKLSVIKADGETILKAGQKLIAIGTKDQIQELNNLAV